MEHFAHDGPAASCTEYPVQTQLGLKRTCIQEEHMHGPDIVERTEQKIIFSLVLAQGVFSPAVDLRFLLCPWARVYFKVAVKHVRTDSQDLGVEMLKT